LAFRAATVLLAFLGAIGASAQSFIWQNVPTNLDRLGSTPATLTPKQMTAVRAVLAARSSHPGVWECDDGSWLEDLQFSRVSVAPYAVFLVEAGSGCARGGQGANGAMWLVAFDGTHAHVIASPDIGLNGWLYSVVPQSHHGLHDIVLGWHMSAFEAGLTYFEFNGVSYKAVSSATLKSDDSGNGKIIPSPRPSK
jgi:hypothetical protein